MGFYIDRFFSWMHTQIMANEKHSSDSRDFSGIWRCSYRYPSNQRPGEQNVSEYYMQAKQRGDKLTLESIKSKPNHMVVNITISESLATGTWVENTDPDKEFAGLEYSGAMQLIIQNDGTSMVGAWVGIGRETLPDGTFEPRIYTGPWEMHRVATAEPKKAA
jgi:hypothetical protein